MQALGENINCVGVKLTSETRDSLKDCIKTCIKDAACKFMTWLQKRRLCETRETCEEFVPLIMPDPEEKVLLYMKRTGKFIHINCSSALILSFENVSLIFWHTNTHISHPRIDVIFFN